MFRNYAFWGARVTIASYLIILLITESVHIVTLSATDPIQE